MRRDGETDLFIFDVGAMRVSPESKLALHSYCGMRSDAWTDEIWKISKCIRIVSKNW